MKLTFKRKDKITGFNDLPLTIFVRVHYSETANADAETSEEYIELNSPEDEQLSYNGYILNDGVVEFEINGAFVDFFITLGPKTIFSKDDILLGKNISVNFGLSQKHKEAAEEELAIFYRIAAGEDADKAAIDCEESAAPELDPSQISNQDDTPVAKKIGQIIFVVGIFGILVSVFLIVADLDSGDSVSLWFILSGLAIVFGAKLSDFVSQGIRPRCPKCNSNLVSHVKRDERNLGTYTKQELLTNRNTMKNEWRQVVRTDFEIKDYYKCNFCNNAWSNCSARSTNSN